MPSIIELLGADNPLADGGTVDGEPGSDATQPDTDTATEPPSGDQHGQPAPDDPAR